MNDKLQALNAVYMVYWMIIVHAQAASHQAHLLL